MSNHIHEGDDEEVWIDVVDVDDSALNLTNWNITWILASGEYGTPEITKTKVGNNITLDQNTTGRFIVDLAPDDTEGLGGRSWYQEAELVDTNDKNATVVPQELEIRKTAVDN